MKVARYEVPGIGNKIWPRPRGTAEIRGELCAPIFPACPESGVPPGRGPSSYAIQPRKLATIMKYLQDKRLTQLLRSSAKLTLMGLKPWAGLFNHFMVSSRLSVS